MALYLPRLTVLVGIEADRPRAWFPGPLGPYLTWFSAIYLSRDFKRTKMPGNPMKSFAFWLLFGGKIKKKIFDSRQPNHVKHLPSGLNKLLKGNFRSLESAPGDHRGACCTHFSIRKLPPRFRFLSVDRNQRQGLTGA